MTSEDAATVVVTKSTPDQLKYLPKIDLKVK